MKSRGIYLSPGGSKMQTFLPYADFDRCAKVLDNKRLYKQIVECKQILQAIENKRNGIKSGWQNHPATLMWFEYYNQLKSYQWCMLREWVKRRWGFHICVTPSDKLYSACFNKPDWLGNDKLHKSHRLNLLFKDPDHYSQYFNEKVPTEKPDYYWPVKKEDITNG